jgi:DNA-binding CsgD family transcriptional regulator/cell division septum initiation protein DivIVA
VAVRLAQEIGDVNWLGYGTIGQAYDALRYGDPGDAAQRFEEASALFVTAADPWGEMNAAYGLALAAHATNSWQRLLAACRRIVDLSQRIASPWGTIRGITCLAPLIAAAEAVTAARVLGAATAHGESMGFLHNLEGVRLHDDARALARQQLGDARFTAVWHEGRSMALSEAAAEALQAAALLDRRYSTRDATSSEPALETAPAFPVQPDNLQGDPGAASVAMPGLGSDKFELSSPLTRREREVLALLCQRLTDREIAERLCISPRTASRHVANIFDKLEVSSRRAAAAHAAAHGLV